MKNAFTLVVAVSLLQTCFAQEYPKLSVVQFIQSATPEEICEHPEVDCFSYELSNVKIGPEDIYATVKAKANNEVSGPFYIYQVFLENQYLRSGYFMLRKIKEEPVYEVHASHILTETFTPGRQDTMAAYLKTKALYDRIKKSKAVKDTFEYCAMMYGKDGTAERKGDLGWFREGIMVKPFEEACFAAQKDDLLLVRTVYGYHIVYINDKRALPGSVIKTEIYYLRKEGECFQGEPCFQK